MSEQSWVKLECMGGHNYRLHRTSVMEVEQRRIEELEGNRVGLPVELLAIAVPIESVEFGLFDFVVVLWPMKGHWILHFVLLGWVGRLKMFVIAPVVGFVFARVGSIVFVLVFVVAFLEIVFDFVFQVEIIDA